MQTIMIVEDDPDIRDGVRILLSGEGYRILEAETAPALSACSHRKSIWSSSTS